MSHFEVESKCMTGVTLQWASERGHNGADLEAQKHRNEVEPAASTHTASSNGNNFATAS